MGFSFSSWAGDAAGKVIGRQSNRALISLTFTNGEMPSGLFQTIDLGQTFQLPAFNGVPWYYNMYVTCLAPKARFAIATGVDPLDSAGMIYSVQMAEVDLGDGSSAWQTGVNLFSVVAEQGPDQSSTIATVIVDGNVQRVDLSNLSGIRASAAVSMLAKPLQRAGTRRVVRP